jgi:hypothetical protein
MIGPIPDSGSRAGHIAVGADTPAAARTLARGLAESVIFEVASEPAPVYG